MKNNDQIVLKNFYHVNFIAKVSNSTNIQLDFNNDLVEIFSKTFPNVKIQLKGAIDNGDIIDVYIKEIYRNLPVKDSVVVDIGANIGDSPIYFALKNSKKVIALEPFPKNYEMAKKNIELNNIENKVILLHKGCLKFNGTYTVDSNFKGVDSQITDSNQGIKIPITTLEQLIKDYKIEQQSILKIDCEGCEYDVLLSSPTKILQTFSHIFIEYHHGYKNLKKKLIESGFQVSVTAPSISGQISLFLYYMHKIRKLNTMKSERYLSHTAPRLACVGQIYAIRK
ncbi:MAG: FkbM family methyltransferase [Nitrosarchaeum sp.]|nr:FkbM family methyltransferase [Nitrosarchaeum sp.]